MRFDMETAILGVDPGFDRCGVAVLVKSTAGDTLIHSTCITTDAHAPFPERLHDVATEVRHVITAHNVSVLALERLFLANNQKTAMQVSEVRGALLFVGREYHLAIHEFAPLEIKRAITGDGRADKRQMMAMVPKLVAMEERKRRDDEYDAIAVALTASATLRPAKQKDA